MGAYQKWTQLNECNLADETKKTAQVIGNWPADKKPFFSIILEVNHVNWELLDRTIHSIREQVYPHWELCCVAYATCAPQVKSRLEKWMREDSRIKVFLARENRRHLADSNKCLDLATGNYCILVDPTYELRPHSLFEVAKAIIDNPYTLFVYADED